MILVAVAGCLFEVHLDRAPGSGHWGWDDEDGAVTLISSHLAAEPPDACRLRFRAEREGTASLRFIAPDGRLATMTIAIAPESQ